MEPTFCLGKQVAVLNHRWDDEDAPRYKHQSCTETTNFHLGKCRHCCSICEGFWNEVGLCGGTFSAQGQYILKKFEKHRREDHGLVPTTTHVGNGTYKGAFAFTLTKSPSDELSVEDMIAAARKILNQKSNPTKRFAWFLEYKEEEKHPHIHGMYETETGGRIESKHFKRAWPIWDPTKKLGAGFRGGYHRPVRHGEAYDDYIAKDGGIGELFNLLHNNNISS